MAQNRGEYWYFHQQDDLVSPDYVRLLLGHAREHPEAAVVYSDLKAFGTLDLVMHEETRCLEARPGVRSLCYRII